MIPENIWLVINELIRDEDYNYALTLLEAAYGNDPGDQLTLAAMALVHCYLGDYEQSDQLLAKAIAGTAPFEVYWLMGVILLEAGLVDEAVAFWQKVEAEGVTSGYFDAIDYFDVSDDDLAYTSACINDCRYMLCQVFHQLGKKHLAQRYKRAYVSHLEEGIHSRFEADNLPE
jgi:hypothetical protein